MSVLSRVLRSIIHQNKYMNFAPVAIRNNHYRRSEDGSDGNGNKKNYKKYRKVTAIALFSSVLLGSQLTDLKQHAKKHQSFKVENLSNTEVKAGEKRPDLPTYRADEVSKHDTKESFWVTYKHGVYDVTKFLPSHPGGDQILNAGGLSIEPFWNVYGMHKSPKIYELLESYRIGNLHDDDVVEHSGDELWVKEPVRDKRLMVKSKNPFNAEIPPQYQIQHFDTPNELFYVRQHMPVPELEASTHSVTVDVEGCKTQQFKLDELGRFKRVEIRAALMCAGNRRSEMVKNVPNKEVKGISWRTGAISNAVWSGVLLRDVLLHCGVDEDDTKGKHVIFQGADIDATGVNFSTSIPLHMAMNPSSKILLATHMNGKELPPDHGYPLRVVVPGAAAVRSVKWCEKITVSTEESPSHWHQKDYRGFNSSKTWETANFATAPPVYTLPVTSAICDPIDGATVPVKNGCIEVKGYAYSGGGASILRVDVSTDGGESWVEAEPVAVDSAPPKEHYAWTLWAAKIPVDKGQKEVELWVKATDSNFNTQPERFDHIWNIRGILSNAYHRVRVQLDHEKRGFW